MSPHAFLMLTETCVPSRWSLLLETDSNQQEVNLTDRETALIQRLLTSWTTRDRSAGTLSQRSSQFPESGPHLNPMLARTSTPRFSTSRTIYLLFNSWQHFRFGSSRFFFYMSKFCKMVLITHLTKSCHQNLFVSPFLVILDGYAKCFSFCFSFHS